MVTAWERWNTWPSPPSTCQPKPSTPGSIRTRPPSLPTTNGAASATPSRCPAGTIRTDRSVWFISRWTPLTTGRSRASPSSADGDSFGGCSFRRTPHKNHQPAEVGWYSDNFRLAVFAAAYYVWFLVSGASARAPDTTHHASRLPEISPLHPLIRRQSRRRAAEHDFAGLQHVAAVSDGQGDVGVLFDHEHADALVVHLFDDLEDAFDEQGREAHRWFVHQDELRAAHQGAAHGEHLLFPAGHGAAHLVEAFRQAREQFEHVIEVLLQLRAVLTQVGAHLQVLFHGQAREDAPVLRNDGHAAGAAFGGRHRVGPFAAEVHLAFAAADDAEDRFQGGGFAAGVAAEQADHLAAVDDHIHVVQYADGPVGGGDVVQFQYRGGFAHGRSPSSSLRSALRPSSAARLPRYASMTAGLSTTSR